MITSMMPFGVGTVNVVSDELYVPVDRILDALLGVKVGFLLGVAKLCILFKLSWVLVAGMIGEVFLAQQCQEVLDV